MAFFGTALYSSKRSQLVRRPPAVSEQGSTASLHSAVAALPARRDLVGATGRRRSSRATDPSKNLDAVAALEDAARPPPPMTSWWCASEPYTACGLFEGNVEDNAPESPSKTTHVELEFVELPRRDGDVETVAWMQPPSQLPYATATDGVGGRLKAKPEHFRVTELLRNAPDGKRDRGDACHYVLRIRRQNRTTEWVRRRLQEAFGLQSYRDVGVCGQKDKRAVTVQHFSVPSFSPKFERNVPLGECKMLAPCRGDLEVLEVMVSSTKLRRGSHRSNAFQIVLTGVDRDALEACELTLKRLQFTGVPNYFGPQRFVSMRRPSFDVVRSRRCHTAATPSTRCRAAATASTRYRVASTLSTRPHESLSALPRCRDAVDAATQESPHRARAARQLYEATRT